MAEPWPIDGERLFEFLSDQLVNETGVFSKGVNKGLNIARSAIRNVDAVEPIDPETLPIVQELQAQVKEQKEQLGHLKYWGLDRKIVLESAAQDRAAVNVMRKRCEKTIAELRAELKRVTAERDAAMKYRAELADYLLATCGKYCFGDHDTVPCSWRDSNGICKLREWKEAVAENATTESEVQADG